MKQVSVDELDTEGEARRLGLSDALETTDFAINRYSLDPGEEFSSGLHTHMDQEETFYIVSGTATFEHATDPLEDTVTVEVGPNEAVRFGPGEYQTGSNYGDEPVEALAFGAPKGSEDVRVPGPCPECETDALQLTFDGGEMGTVCPECGTEPGAKS